MSSHPLEVASRAKVNLHLQVVGRRGDGYHELRTIFQERRPRRRAELVELGAPGVRLAVRGSGALRRSRQPGPSRGERLPGALGRRPRRRHDALRKRIPMGGGLGGGSSNAATVLLALQRLLGEPAPPDELWQLARELGADVPYFLVGGTALGRGPRRRGDAPSRPPVTRALAGPAAGPRAPPPRSSPTSAN